MPVRAGTTSRSAIFITAAVCLLPLWLAAEVLAQATVLEVIPLRYRSAPEVIPVIRPMLAQEGSISGLQGQLIVRTTPANLEEIKRILASIDTAPRQLLITVRQDTEGDRRRAAAEVSGSVGGEHGRVTIPGGGDRRGGAVVLREGDDHVRAQVFEGRRAESARSAQAVRVMEGREAYILMGLAMPVRERQVRRTIIGGQVVEQVVEGTQYRDVNSGFYVRPRLSGERVILEIRPQQEAVSGRPPGSVSIQSMATTVSGAIGEWIEIGGIGEDASGRQAVLLGQAVTASRASRRIRVKVEEVR